MKKIIVYSFLLFGSASESLWAQDARIIRTPEEQKELFGYCEKPELMKKLKFSSEMADKVGEIDFWGRVQKLSVEANTNDAYATPKEVDQEVLKKYKAIRLNDDQLKALIDFKHALMSNPSACAITTLTHYRLFDTLSNQQAILMYKTKYRKSLLTKAGINGRQADGLIEIEIWKQKESVLIAAIPEADFNRIRKTVALHIERERKFRVIGLSEEQLELVSQFFDQNFL